ncbi:MAG: family 20 glycosylhydrolase [Planctomycetota bacterium]|nr:family 20 glycosylhydrolase [Planctomycetota bacterium]
MTDHVDSTAAADPANRDPLLLPRPKRLTFGGGVVDAPPLDALTWRAPLGLDVPFIISGPTSPRTIRCVRRGADQPAWLECRVDPERPRDPSTCRGQSYSLRIAPAPREHDPVATITAGNLAGLRHGIATLRQLLSQYAPRPIPAMAISDEPSFPVRGVMLDVSRDRVPTMSELARVVDWLASFKFNHLQLYTEHTFAYAGHEDVWRDWSPITPEETRELDALCRARGIELAANQNCFGHLASWLRLPQYQHLAETQGDWMFDVWPRSGPFSLCPTDPASLEFVQDLLGQLLPCFTSPLVNVGCDETYDIAYGRSKDEVARRGRAAVYLDFVERVFDLCRQHGKRPMFWGDIVLSEGTPASEIARLSSDVIPLAWGYEPDSAFEQWGHVLASRERTFWSCPGTSCWRSILGRTSERRGNLIASARAAKRHNAPGFMVCEWGDTGHWQQWPIVAHALAHAAAWAWSAPEPRPEPTPEPAPESTPQPGHQAQLAEPVHEHAWLNADDSDIFDLEAASLHALDDRSLMLGAWLEAAGNADLPLRLECLGLSRPGKSGRLLNQSALFIDLLKPWNEATDVGSPEQWNAAAARLADASKGLERLLTAERSAGASASSLRTSLADELRHSVAFAQFAADRACARRASHRPGTAAHTLAELRERWAALVAEHEQLWRLRSREGGLHHSRHAPAGNLWPVT